MFGLVITCKVLRHRSNVVVDHHIWQSGGVSWIGRYQIGSGSLSIPFPISILGFEQMLI